jgi:hypothetical protein
MLGTGRSRLRHLTHMTPARLLPAKVKAIHWQEYNVVASTHASLQTLGYDVFTLYQFT